MKKKCKDCGVIKEQENFYGIQGECKKCTRERVQKNYATNRGQYAEYERQRWKDPERRKKALEYQRKRRASFKGKNRARQAVSNALRDGRLTRQNCEKCGNEKSQAHHPDYRSPLRVMWLCRTHHLLEHKKIAY